MPEAAGIRNVGKLVIRLPALSTPDKMARMKASYQCGQLSDTVRGAMVAVVACHCLARQKRPRSSFGETAGYAHRHAWLGTMIAVRHFPAARVG